MEKNNPLPSQIEWSGATQQEKVVQNAIDRVRLAHELARGEKLYVAFSGGKDSIVMRDIVRRAADLDGIPYNDYYDLHYHITGIDPPELVYFMRDNFAELQWDKYDKSMWQLIEDKGPPTRLKRFCCAELKETKGGERMCCTGVRWSESIKRSKRAAYETITSSKADKILFNDNDDARRTFETCIKKQKRVCNPIIDFTLANVWSYIHDRSLAYCCLYDEGFDRLGCIGCPMADKHRTMQFKRWPKFKNLYMRAFDRFLQKRKNKGLPTIWETAQDVFDWWMDDKNMDKPLPDQLDLWQG